MMSSGREQTGLTPVLDTARILLPVIFMFAAPLVAKFQPMG